MYVYEYVCARARARVPVQVTVGELQRHPALPLLRQLAAGRLDVR